MMNISQFQNTQKLENSLYTMEKLRYHNKIPIGRTHSMKSTRIT